MKLPSVQVLCSARENLVSTDVVTYVCACACGMVDPHSIAIEVGEEKAADNLGHGNNNIFKIKK